MIADWWRQQLVANVVTINHGFSGQQYVHLVDGSWLAPVGAPGTFVLSGSRVKVRDGCHTGAFDPNQSYGVSTPRRWNITASSQAQSGVLTTADGQVITFNAWSWNYAGSPDDLAEDNPTFLHQPERRARDGRRDA